MLVKPEFKQSRETEIIYDLFITLADRETPLVTYSEIKEMTGLSIDRTRGAVHTAIRRARKHDGIVIECDRNIGYRLRQNTELAGSAQRGSERARRIQRVALEKAQCADRSKLNGEERAALDVQTSVLELSLIVNRPRTISNVTQMVVRKHNELDDSEMLEAIRNALVKK